MIYTDISLSTIEKISRDAGAIILDYYKKGVVDSYKDTRSIVTEADLKSEEYIKKALNRAHPCSFYGEESGGEVLSKGDQWIVDPLDGTENMSGYPPMIGVSIGLLHDGKPVLGVIFDVIHNVLYSASQGKGAQKDHKPIRVKDTHNLAQARISFDLSSKSYTWPQAIKQIEILIPKVLTLKLFGAPVLSLAAVASGELDLYYRPATKLPDIIAGICIVEEAGGCVVDYSGKPWSLSSTDIIAGSPKMIENYLAIFQKT